MPLDADEREVLLCCHAPNRPSNLKLTQMLGGSVHWPNSTPYEESKKRPVFVGRIGFIINGLVHCLPKHPGTNRCRTKHADTNRCRTKTSPGLLGRRRG